MFLTNSSNGAHRENTQKTRAFVCMPPKYTVKYLQFNLYRDEKAIYKNIIRSNIARRSIYGFRRVRGK